VKPAKATPGALLVDSLQFSQSGTAEQAKAIRAIARGVYIYLGVATAEIVQIALDADLAVIPCTTANAFDGEHALRELAACGFCSGLTVQLDIEGASTLTVPLEQLTSEINGWAGTIKSGSFLPAGYIGTPQPFTSEELYALAVAGYWRGQGRIVDRFSSNEKPTLAEPRCGWWAYQAWPSQEIGGVLVDFDMITADYEERVPVWGVA
jgi:hypothetical protein